MARQTNAVLHLLLPVIFFAGIYFINSNGCISYLWTLLLFLITNFLLDKNYRTRNFYAFHFFLFLAIIMYFGNLHHDPTQLGLTGGVGITDDTAYFAAASDTHYSNITISGHATRDSFWIQLIRFLYPFKIIDPINIIILNVFMGLSFLPYLTAKISEELFHDKKIASYAFLLITFCPFCWQGGLIIMRDVPTLILILTAFYNFLKKRYLLVAGAVTLLILIKMGFIVFLIIPVACYIISRTGKGLTLSKVLLTLLIVIGTVAFYLFIIPNLSAITGGKMTDDDIFRSNFLGFLQRSNEESLLVKIYGYPIIVRIPLLILAFLTIPMLKFSFGYTAGIGFIPRYVLMVGIYPIYIMIFSRYIFNTVAFKYKERNVKMMMTIVVLIALALGMVSLQVRHKVVLMPFLYMLAAYGMVKCPKIAMGRLYQIIFIIANLVYATITS